MAGEPTITPQLFEVLATRLNCAPNVRDMARAVLVDGQKVAEVAQQYKMSRQGVQRIAQRFRAAAPAAMTPQEFEALQPHFKRLSADSIEIARAVLVDGMKTSEVAALHKMTRQRVHGIVQRVRAAGQQVPTRWRRVEVWLPPELAEQVEALAEQAKAAYGSSGNSGVSE